MAEEFEKIDLAKLLQPIVTRSIEATVARVTVSTPLYELIKEAGRRAEYDKMRVKTSEELEAEARARRSWQRKKKAKEKREAIARAALGRPCLCQVCGMALGVTISKDKASFIVSPCESCEYDRAMEE